MKRTVVVGAVVLFSTLGLGASPAVAAPSLTAPPVSVPRPAPIQPGICLLLGPDWDNMETVYCVMGPTV